jgi:hypothetical protein
MRRAARIDANQREIVAALRDILGCTVMSLAGVGNGCPDLAVGWRGRNYFLEVKPPCGPLGGISRQTLTDAEQQWHRTWRGQRAIVTTVDQALYEIGATRVSAARKPA